LTDWVRFFEKEDINFIFEITKFSKSDSWLKQKKISEVRLRKKDSIFSHSRIVLKLANKSLQILCKEIFPKKSIFEEEYRED